MLKIAALFLASAAGVAGAGATASTASTASPSSTHATRPVAVSPPAPASTDSSATLMSAVPWWEKVTVTLDGDGKPEACRYETSLSPAKAEQCDVGADQAAAVGKASESHGEITRITFERRFNPGAAPQKPKLELGDTLLGGQMMALAIDGKGAVKGCQVVAASGAMRPEYSCDDAQAEKFQASYNPGGKQAPDREGYMTILVYGHSEHMV